VADSWKEQLLLNIVKTRYADAPTFLEVSSLVSGYSLETGVSINGQFSPENLRGDSFAGGEVSGKFTDRPTISYTPMTGERFARSLIAPVPLDALLFVVQGGVPADFLLGLTLESIERQQNMNMYGLTFTPADPQFEKLLRLLRTLQLARLAELEVLKTENRTETWLRLYPAEVAQTEAAGQLREFRTLLKIPAETDRAKIVFGTWAEDTAVVGMRTRSLLQILTVLGAGIQVPVEHVKDGSAASVEERQVAGGFTVCSGKKKPEEAFVAVPYENMWFWIERGDRTSKYILATLTMLFSFIDSGGSKVSPILTIPTS
jgi:hypothetical protein